MPILSVGGLAWSGVGDGRLAIDGSVPPGFADAIIGGVSPLTVTSGVYQRRFPAGHYQIESYDTVTRQTTTLADHGANFMGGGAGQWIGWLSPTVISGTFGPLAGVGLWGLTAAGTAAVSRDGFVLIRPDYQSDRGLRVVGPGGVTWFTDDAAVGLACNDGWVLYRRHGSAHLRQLATGQRLIPTLLGTGDFARLAVVGDTVWILEAFAALTLHPATSAIGYVIGHRDGHDFYPDVVAQGAGALQVASSYTAGERPEDVQRYLVDLSAPRQDLVGVALPPVIVVPPTPPTPPEPPVPAPPPPPPTPPGSVPPTPPPPPEPPPTPPPAPPTPPTTVPWGAITIGGIAVVVVRGVRALVGWWRRRP